MPRSDSGARRWPRPRSCSNSPSAGCRPRGSSPPQRRPTSPPRRSRGRPAAFSGEIRAIKGERIIFETRDRLHVGDRIRVQPKSDMAGRAFTVKEMFVGKEPVKRRREKTLVAIPAPFAFKIGRHGVQGLFGNRLHHERKRLPAGQLGSGERGKIPAGWRFTGTRGRCGLPPGQARWSLSCSSPWGSWRRPAPPTWKGCSGPSLPGPATPVRTCLLRGPRFSGAPHTAGSAQGDPAGFLPGTGRTGHDGTSAASGKRPAGGRWRLSSARQARPAAAGRADGAARAVRDCHLLHQEGIDAVSLPVSRANMHQLPAVNPEDQVEGTGLSWRLPFIIFEADLPFYREAVGLPCRAGFPPFRGGQPVPFSSRSGDSKGECDRFPVTSDTEEMQAGNSHRLPALLPQQPGAACLAGTGRRRGHPLHRGRRRKHGGASGGRAADPAAGAGLRQRPGHHLQDQDQGRERGCAAGLRPGGRLPDDGQGRSDCGHCPESRLP